MAFRVPDRPIKAGIHSQSGDHGRVDNILVWCILQTNSEVLATCRRCPDEAPDVPCNVRGTGRLADRQYGP